MHRGYFRRRSPAPAGRTVTWPGQYPRKVFFMHRHDLLTGIRERARLHGPNEARRVLRAVLATLGEFVPGPVRDLTRELPADLGIALSGSASAVAGDRTCRDFLSRVAGRLLVDEAEAAFLSRITLGELNVFCRGLTPAGIAPMVPADLRPLLRALPDDPARRQQRVLHMTVPATVTRRPDTAARPVPVTADVF